MSTRSTQSRTPLALLLSRPRVLTGASFGLSGALFIVANLLLARELAVEQYALIALLVGVVNVAMIAAPLGIDGAVARKSVTTSAALLRRVLLSAALVAVVAALFSRLAYGINLTIAGLLVVCVCAGAIMIVAAARFQALHAFGRSLVYLRSQDYAVFIASIATLVAGAHQALMPFAVMTGIFLLVAVSAWRDAVRNAGSPGARMQLSWRETAAYLSIQLSATVLMQLEKLLTPTLLTLRDLATLGVVLALVGPPFRLLQMTVGYSLQPRLRSATSVAERMRMLTSEAALAAMVVVGSSIVLWFATPLLLKLLLHDKFAVSAQVLLAALISGALKVASGFAKACMTALANNRQLFHVGVISWVGIALAVAGAAIGARYGLSGVIYGVAVGWAVRILASACFVAGHLRNAPAT